MIPDTYMLNQMDAWITGNYGDDYFEDKKEEYFPEDDIDFCREDE